MKKYAFTASGAIVAALLLALLSWILSGDIQEAELAARSEVYSEVWPGAAGFAEVDSMVERLDKVNALASEKYNGAKVLDALTVLDENGNAVGMVLKASSPNGYGGELSAVLAVKDGAVTGFLPVVMNESAGFGAKCAESDFAEKALGVTAPEQLDGISGATVTTKALRELFGAALTLAADNCGEEG